MRISTSQFYNTSSANYQRTFSNVNKTTQEASDFLRIRTAADDPVGAARLLQLEQQQDMLKQYSGNIVNVRNALGTAESTLNAIGSILQRVNELAISSGNAGFTDSDRKANAAELASLEDQLFSLMNSKDENGKYLFSGSKGDTPPYVRNADGTYTYQGDQSSLMLQVGDMLSLAANETGYSAFEQALNTSRSETNLTAPPVDDGRVSLSNGQVSGSVTYNDRFRSGEPYSIEFLSSTQFKITDAAGNDVTMEATQGGKFDPNGDNTMISFRGVDLRLDISFQAGDEVDPDAAIAGHTFSLASKPDTITGTRSPGNTSASQLAGATITDPDAYKAAFPGGGAVLKFTSATDFELYASPLTADSRPISTGTLSGNTATVMGVSFELSGPPNVGDAFNVKVDTHQTQNALDTISQLRAALETPVDNDPVAKQKLQAALDSAIGNIASATNQVTSSISSIGGRGQALDVQAETNEALSTENLKTQSSIRESDPAEVMLRLEMQKNMLQASMQSFAKIAGLSLVNYI
ncbi:flagellar hook-associated protein 3 [Pseudomonas guariconensis]|uniref:flagellar hook-associated protein 3 n=1 Tax=Pseudomonas TaxID=286 RepID=UPI00209686A6|nr:MULTISPECIES: flagellar hook-associated protein 3 [Pseudomonas]MCO7642439.1 flagellar hook-associated protein 3 [Pseudomonas sp. S 311-6]MCO7516141.1 flagellar hook-associated protein 3 [Pseudomonas putida]MCO7566743.1 flagellar hook-associated protein 3 [Pseudomonas mosselii]MCO7606065.1 flagellar hook-associated protein 3 [Pseudomonas guariconensis]MCO7618732.1 flagellar hook-associated protein 3 [Pseudomonas guariconensis]